MYNRVRGGVGLEGAGMEKEQKWGNNRGRTEHGTGAGISVTTDGLQERVPISSFRVKQREKKNRQKDQIRKGNRKNEAQ